MRQTVNQARGTLDGCIADDDTVHTLVLDDLSDVNQLGLFQIRRYLEQQFGSMRLGAKVIPGDSDLA
jgi:hypothetical protein